MKTRRALITASAAAVMAVVAFAQQVGGHPAGSSSGNVSPNTPGLGLNATLLPHWIACTAKVKINAGNCRVYAIGDSTTLGLYSNGTDTGDYTLGAYPTRMAQYMDNAQFLAQRDAFMGDGTATGSVDPPDARVSIGGWTAQAATSTGGALYAIAASGAPLTFAPTDTVNTFVIWYVTQSGGGSFSWAIDSGSPTTVSQVGPTGIASTTATIASVGTHTINLNWVSGTPYIIGVEAYNSTVGSVVTVNTGISGYRSADLILDGEPYNFMPAVVAQAPDVILLDIGINDWNDVDETVAQFTANMQILITAWEANSDVVLVTPAPTATSITALARQQQFVAAMYSLASTNNIPIIDNFARWQSYERMSASPYLLYANTVHPNANGYSDSAQSIASQLLSIVGH